MPSKRKNPVQMSENKHRCIICKKYYQQHDVKIFRPNTKLKFYICKDCKDVYAIIAEHLQTKGLKPLARVLMRIVGHNVVRDCTICKYFKKTRIDRCKFDLNTEVAETRGKPTYARKCGKFML